MCLSEVKKHHSNDYGIYVQCALNVTAPIHLCNVNWWRHLCIIKIICKTFYIIHIFQHWTHSFECIHRKNEKWEWRRIRREKKYKINVKLNNFRPFWFIPPINTLMPHVQLRVVNKDYGFKLLVRPPWLSAAIDSFSIKVLKASVCYAKF